jgi:hypothetical protein
MYGAVTAIFVNFFKYFTHEILLMAVLPSKEMYKLSNRVAVTNIVIITFLEPIVCELLGSLHLTSVQILLAGHVAYGRA